MDELGKNGCTNDVCSSALKIQDGKDAIACTIPTRVNEDVGVKGNCKSAMFILSFFIVMGSDYPLRNHSYSRDSRKCHVIGGMQEPCFC